MESPRKNIQTWVATLDRVIRSRRTYHKGNSVFTRLMDECWNTLAQILSEHPEFKLTIGLHEIFWEDQIVYQNAQRGESLAFKLASEGIQALQFSDGITREELEQFLECLSELQKPVPTEDVLGKLWESDFPHITYTIAETLVEGSEDQSTDNQRTEESVREILDPQMSHYAGEAAEADDIFEDLRVTVTVPSMGNLFNDSVSLTPEEFDYIQSDIEACEAYDRLRLDFVDMLLAVLQEEKTSQDFKKFFTPLTEVIQACFSEGHLELAFKIIDQISRFPTVNPKLNEVFPNFLEDAMSQIWTASSLDMVLIAHHKAPFPLEILEKRLQHLPQSLIPPLIDKALETPEMPLKLCLLRVVAHSHKGDFASLHPLLGSQDTDLLRLGLYVLVHTKNPKALDFIEKLLSHKVTAVRKDALTGLKAFPGPHTLSLLTQALNDSEEDIRATALRQLASLGNRDVARFLGEIVASPTFKEKSLNERKLYFLAIAGIIKDDFIPHLKKILSTTKWFQDDYLTELYQCATLALTVIASPSARATLESALRSSDKNVRRLSEMALKQLGKEVSHEAQR